MIINELVINQDSCFTDIQCRMTIKQKIVAKNGRVEMFGDNQFKFITKDNVIDFSIVDKNDAKLIMESFNRHFYCLANVTGCSNIGDDGKVFFLHIGFFYNLQRWGKTPIILSDEIKSNIEKKYVKGRETLEQVLEENFQLSDGVSSYFAYTSGKYYFGSDEQDENEIEGADKVKTPLLEEKNEEKLDKDKIDQIIEKEKQKKDTLVIYGREFYIYVSIQGDKFNEKLYVEKIGKKKWNAPMLRMAEGTLEFFDHNSILSKKVKETLESTKGYLDLWNQYAEQEGNLLLEEVRKVGLITVNRGAATFDSEGIHLPYSGLTKEAEELIANDTYLFFSDEIPVYLADSEMTWSDYRTLSKEASQIGYSINKGVQVKVNKRKNGGFIIETEDGHLPEQKYVSLSIL